MQTVASRLTKELRSHVLKSLCVCVCVCAFVVDAGEESLAERMARRNLALSQLTKPATSVPSSGATPPSALSTNVTTSIAPSSVQYVPNLS